MTLTVNNRNGYVIVPCRSCGDRIYVNEDGCGMQCEACTLPFTDRHRADRHYRYDRIWQSGHDYHGDAPPDVL